MLIKQESHGRQGRNQTQDLSMQKNLNQLVKKTPGGVGQQQTQKSITRLQSSKKRNSGLTQSVDQKSKALGASTGHIQGATPNSQ